jgi:hypothetical protein
MHTRLFSICASCALLRQDREGGQRHDNTLADVQTCAARFGLGPGCNDPPGRLPIRSFRCEIVWSLDSLTFLDTRALQT